MTCNPFLLPAMQLANAVYVTDRMQAVAGFARLGYETLDWYSSSTAQCALVRDSSKQVYLPVAGTRVSNGSLLDTVYDVEQDAEEFLKNYTLSNGSVVASGAYDRATEVWNWAASRLAGKSVTPLGHSLGGQTTHALFELIPEAQLTAWYAFAPPKAGDDRFWLTHAGKLTKGATVLNGRDGWSGHPMTESVLLHPPGPLVHLHDKSWSFITREQFSPSVWHFADHDTSAYLAALQAVTQ